MSAPAEQETKKITTADELRSLGSITTDARTRLLGLASALDALASACGGCEAELHDGTLCGEYDETRIALCPVCARKRDTAITHLTGAPRP